MNNEKSIKGVFFDLGGTLYSYRHVGAATAKILGELAQRLQLALDLHEVVGHYRQASQDADRVYAERPFYLFSEYFETVFDNLLQRLDRQHLREHLAWYDQQQRITLMPSLELRADCHPTLDSLKAQGLYLSVVSNSDEDMLQPLVERAQLHRWLDHWTSSEAARSCKPDRRFFEVALHKSGLAADEVLFVGDSLEQDILGARAIGMSTALITEIEGHAPMHVGRETVEPDYRIDSLASVVDIVAGLRG